jgi:hypothetical protein
VALLTLVLLGLSLTVIWFGVLYFRQQAAE